MNLSQKNPRNTWVRVSKCFTNYTETKSPEASFLGKVETPMR